MGITNAANAGVIVSIHKAQDLNFTYKIKTEKVHFK